MSKKILHRGELRNYKRKDYDEVFLFFKKFAINSDLLFLKSNPNHLSRREKTLNIKYALNEAIGIETEKCLLIDSDTDDIVAFYSFHTRSKTVEWIFVNPDYFFSEKLLDSAMSFFKKMSKKYNLPFIRAKLLKRSNFERYVKFVCKHYNGKVIFEAEDYTTVNLKM